jgi:DNA-binding transcriptional LysR family regulator
MELGELKTFVTVAAEHSFSLAAIKLCRTQPAVSQAIRRLEEDLGERLFDRRAKLSSAKSNAAPVNSRTPR